MTPAARVQMAIEILDGLESTAQPTDRFLKAWFRTRRFAGSGDRRAIAERARRSSITATASPGSRWESRMMRRGS